MLHVKQRNILLQRAGVIYMYLHVPFFFQLHVQAMRYLPMCEYKPLERTGREKVAAWPVNPYLAGESVLLTLRVLLQSTICVHRDNSPVIVHSKKIMKAETDVAMCSYMYDRTMWRGHEKKGMGGNEEKVQVQSDHIHLLNLPRLSLLLIWRRGVRITGQNPNHSSRMVSLIDVNIGWNHWGGVAQLYRKVYQQGQDGFNPIC